MYLRTPKRYRPVKYQRRHNVFNFRWLWLWLLTPLVAYGGWQLYERRDELRPMVANSMNSAVQSISGGLATAVAPTPTPRPDPSDALAAADGAWQSGAIEEALTAYRSVLPDVPNDVQRHANVALGLIMDGRYPEAVEAAERAINADPYSADGWAIHSYALGSNDQPEIAIASGQQALYLDAAHVSATAYLAYAYFVDNQIERSRTTAERALELDATNPDANLISGIINQEANFDFGAARRDFETALQYAPYRVDVQMRLAWVLLNEDYDAMRDVLLEITELNPNNLDALYATSYLYSFAYGDYEQALEPAQRCVNLSPENRACLFQLGNVQVIRGDNAAALDAYRALIAAGTQRPSHFLAAARAYLNAAGDCPSAITLLQEGYRLEQAEFEPNAARLLEFEELLAQCGSPIAPIAPSADATEEATAGA
ncbi:MAG: tetratricopeptide repeat protein [Chloroflexota bacterium]|nr:tetratricopeptide repeat protein [Chloroflexota bacterium]